MSEQPSRPLCPYIPIAALILTALSICCPCARAQKAAAGPAKISTKNPLGATRGDIKHFVARVNATLADSHAQKAFWGILITDRETAEILYELNGDRFFTPASNAKIFTSALALSTLGSDFRFHTTLQTAGSLSADGRLAGDLILVGHGDPDLSNRKFPYVGKVEREGTVEAPLAELVEQALAKGLKEVDGDIVADDSYFPYDPYPAGWGVGDLFFGFGAPVGALAFNDNSFSLEVRPAEREAEPATVTVEPLAAAQSFTYKLNTGPPGGKPDFSVVRQPGQNFILLRGSIPLGHAPIKLDFAITDPCEVAALALKQALESRGIKVSGGIRVNHAEPPHPFDPASVSSGVTSDILPIPGAMSSDATKTGNTILFADRVSPALVESISVTNKVSQNLHAELFLRTVAEKKTGVGSTEAGLWVEQNFLKAIGIADGDVVLSDASGLARDDLVTPRAVVQLLRYVWQQPWGADYIASFPIAGVDGTLENRMKDTVASGRILAKTGSLEHVRAMSGYATTVHGEHLVFTIFGNNNTQRAHDATAVMDAIAVAMVETLGTPAGTKRKNAPGR